MNEILAINSLLFSAARLFKVHQHRTIEELHDYVPKCVLPVELGGDGPSVKDLNGEFLKGWCMLFYDFRS